MPQLDFSIEKQPDDVTCGPTCLVSVYNYFGADLTIRDVLKTTRRLEDGGTLAVLLGIDALQRGYGAQLVTYNYSVFDPTWTGLSCDALLAKLIEQESYKTGKKFLHASKAYREFVALGGEILLQDLGAAVLRDYLDAGRPILTGLSATYLYNASREREDRIGKQISDDVRGTPVGHFVVVCGMKNETITVADPYPDHPFEGTGCLYTVPVEKFFHSVLLGDITYDANFLIIHPIPKQ